CLIDTFVVGRICEVEPQPCGDSVLQTSEGEQCDDSNNTNGDGCSSTCQLETTCGNGTIEAGEQCDDDNLDSFDGCSATCQIEAGATCSVTLPTVCSKLVINEVDYDNTAGDNTNGQFEFVEIVNAGTGPADVTNVALILMNGGTSSEYFFDGSGGAANVGKRIALATAAVPANMLAPGGMIVVGPAGLTGTLPGGVFSITVLPGMTGFIQNGAPDAIGLYDLVAARMLDSLAYEGAVTGTIVNVTDPVVFTEGTSSATAPLDTSLANESLSRRNPNARDTQDNATDFSLVAVSPGLPNP
ncbi:MAG TPA: DUF4215 domain-containing protein, partial [Kofleriaceae bacterium]